MENTARLKDYVRTREIGLAHRENSFEIEYEAATLILSECLTHFLMNRMSKDPEEENRYFYSTNELNTFLKAFEDRGGDERRLKIKKVLDRWGEFDYYEVSRKSASELRKEGIIW